MKEISFTELNAGLPSCVDLSRQHSFGVLNNLDINMEDLKNPYNLFSEHIHMSFKQIFKIMTCRRELAEIQHNLRKAVSK